MHIAILEPNIITSRNIRNYLNSVGKYKITECSSAEIAMELFDKNNKPDTIIMEILLPNHNGIDFLHELRSHYDLLNCQIIIYSVLSELKLSKFSRALYDIGAFRVLSKSQISFYELNDLIKAEH